MRYFKNLYESTSFGNLLRYCDARIRTYLNVRLRFCASRSLHLIQNLHFHRGFYGLFLLCLLSACHAKPIVKAQYPTGYDRGMIGNDRDIYQKPDGVLKAVGLSNSSSFSKMLNNTNKPEQKTFGAVNPFLWQASLETISFVPINSADAFGGTILTDWYMPKDQADTRLKLNVFILSPELIASGVQVKLFKQQNIKGAWVDVPADIVAQTALENAILRRARALRVADLEKSR
jgi:hypothetical protein